MPLSRKLANRGRIKAENHAKNNSVIRLQKLALIS